MITPALQDDAFLADVAAARAALSGEAIALWWLGQSGFLLLHRDAFLLFDPYLSESLTRKYAGTDKPHVRMTARVIDPARLNFISVATSSHTHTDHLDADTLRPLFAASPACRLVLPAANLAFVAGRLGAEHRSRFVPLQDAEQVDLGPFRLEAVPAAHEERRPEFAGFIVTAGRHRIYHSGDTVLFPGMAERLRAHRVTLALLPINGRAPERRVAGNLTGREAASLAHEIGAAWVAPCHYDMFAFNTASPDEFVAECRRLGQQFKILRAGERWNVPLE